MTMVNAHDITVSVVVPLLRGREADLDGVAGWTRQSLSTGRFEVLAVSPGDPAHDDEARRLLRHGDRLIVAPGLGESGLWDAGARAALGDVLVLTECHSIPHPGCLAAAIAALSAGLDVACFESRAPRSTAAAWLEDAVFQDLFERYIDDGDPRALSLRGIALPREIYLRSGGLRPDDHECFAERVLAARLANIGARIGRAPGAVVEHAPNARFRAVRADSLNFHRDEVHARLAGAPHEIDPETQLEMTPEWDARARFDPTLNRAALPGLVRLALRREPSARAARQALPRTLARGVAGPQLAAWAAAIRCRFVMAALSIAWRTGRRPDPSSAWAVLSRASVLRILSEQCETRVWADRLQLRADGEGINADHLSVHAAGMHLAEQFNGRAFRWTEPVVVLDLELPAGANAVTVQLLGLRSLGSGDVSAAWGHRHVPATALRIDASTITVLELAEARGPLTLSVTRMRSSGDRRRLGLPIVAVAAS